MAEEVKAPAEEDTKVVPPVTEGETQPDTSKEAPDGDQTTEETKEGDQEEGEPRGVPAEMVKFFVEVEEKGELSEESYADLEKQGYSREVVDTYMRGLTATTTEEDANNVIEMVGGEEAFVELQTWANESLSDADKAKYNRAIKSSDTVEMAVAWLKAKQAEGASSQETQKATDKPARKITGKANPAGEPAVKPFADRAEASKAVRDPRYGRQTAEGIAYTNEVLARIAAGS